MRTRLQILAVLVAALALPLESVLLKRQREFGVSDCFSGRDRPASIEDDVTGALPRALRDLGYEDGRYL